MFDVVGIDIPVVDMNVVIPELPGPNDGKMIRRMTIQGGGKVATGIIAESRLGLNCAILGIVGDDTYGKFVISDFSRHGVDTSGLKVRQNADTTLSIVLSDEKTHGRSIMCKWGSGEELSVQEVNQQMIEKTRWLHIELLDDASVESAKYARAVGAKVMIDADSYSEKLMQTIQYVNAFIASEFVYDALFHGENPKDREAKCRKIMAMGPEIVIFTFGEKGCIGCSQEGYFELPAFKVAVMDTVGAGDVFHGAFLAGYLGGRSVKDSARFASAVSAIKCMRIGGRAGIPTVEMTERFLRDGRLSEEDEKALDDRVAFYERGLDYV